MISVSGDPPEVVAAGLSDKTAKLIDSLVAEESSIEALNEDYNGIIFVTCRDTVLALQQVLSRHPKTCHLFRVGCLVGSCESSYHQLWIDVARNLAFHEQEDALRDFRTGKKNLLVSTSVAEEGLDIQACGSVVRWDLPQDMKSWAQSRGRARRERSTFILMIDDHGTDDENIKNFENQEREMQASFNNSRRSAAAPDKDSQVQDDCLELRIPETGCVSCDLLLGYFNLTISVERYSQLTQPYLI